LNIANSQCNIRSNEFRTIIGTDPTHADVAVSKTLRIGHFSCAPTYSSLAYFTNFESSPMATVFRNMVTQFHNDFPFPPNKNETDLDSGTIYPDMAKAFNNAELSDLTFVTSDGETVSASKWLLCLRSSYFRNLLHGGMIESTQEQIEVDDPANTFKPIIEYIYTDRVNFKDHTYSEIVDILAIADKYVLIGMRKECEKYLMKYIDSTNVFDLLFNVCIDYSPLKKKVIRYFLNHKKVLLETEEAKQLLNYPELMMEIIKNA
jgi:hypothetical protein